jgi:hypothetical protein
MTTVKRVNQTVRTVALRLVADHHPHQRIARLTSTAFVRYSWALPLAHPHPHPPLLPTALAQWHVLPELRLLKLQ